MEGSIFSDGFEATFSQLLFPKVRQIISQNLLNLVILFDLNIFPARRVGEAITTLKIPGIQKSCDFLQLQGKSENFFATICNH